MKIVIVAIFALSLVGCGDDKVCEDAKKIVEEECADEIDWNIDECDDGARERSECIVDHEDGTCDDFVDCWYG